MNLLPSMGIAAVLAALVTGLSTPAVMRLAHRCGVIKVPRARDVHTRPTPSWGGLAICGGFFAAFLILHLAGGTAGPLSTGAQPSHIPEPLLGIAPHPIVGILAGAVLIAVVGILDDRYDLSPRWQMAGLMAPGLIAALLGGRIVGISNPLPGIIHIGSYLPLGLLSVPLTVLWVFVATKTFDFLDGLDGLASGVGAIAAATMGLIALRQGEGAVALLAAATLGASLGFLRFNYHPASIFMGSVGSYFLGYLLAMLAVVGALKVPAAIAVVLPLIVLGVPVFDGLYVIGRRVVRGQRPTEADKTHIHHRLQERGLSVRQAVWAIYGLTAGTCLIALALVWWGH
jgi:UDP-GlcNAc:undecaprenyl-phosphate GlcNAc-1-phosphate transferase